MFVDHTRQSVWDQIRRRDFRAFAPWVTREVIAQAATRAGVAPILLHHRNERDCQ